MLRYGLYPYLEEIIACIDSISLTDKEVEVKRGCIFVLYLLLEGLGIDSFEMIPDHFDKVRRIIEQSRCDSDAVTSYHGEQAHKHFREILTWKPEEIKSPLHIIKH